MVTIDILTEEVKKRFWSNVNKTDGCWLWTGSIDRDGYGKLSVNKVTVKAHRAAWLIAMGSIPNGLCVLHRCDVPGCVRESHLFLGTHKDNVQDKIAKGRCAVGLKNGMRTHPESAPNGERNGRAKLTEDQVRTIRRIYVRRANSRSIQDEFGISASQLHLIVKHKRWRNVT